MSNTQRTFTIGTVARLVGISTHVLRVWERRYNLKLSTRNAKGRRIYTSGEIEKLKLIKQALDKGFKISDIASMSINELIHICTLGNDLSKDNNLAINNNPVSNKIASRNVLVYGDRLAHGLFRARIDKGYRVINKLPNLISEIETSKCLPCTVLIELEDINDEIEELLYSTRLHISEDVSIFLFNRNANAEIQSRLQKAGIHLVMEEITSEVLKPLVENKSHLAPALDGTLDSTRQKVLTETQLDNLLSSKCSVYCECPKHMGDLYLKINEFIRYSDSCEKQSPKDFTVHQFIVENLKDMRTTLTRMTFGVAKMDGLDINESV